MAIEKMKLLSINGSDKELDGFIARNLLDSDIQIEDAKKMYSKAWKLQYYDYDYTVKDNMKKCKELIEELNILYREEYSNLYIENTVSQIGEKVEQVRNAYEDLKNNIANCKKMKDEDIQKITSVEKIIDLNVDMKKLYNLKYIKFRYGNIENNKLDEIRDELEKRNVILFEVDKEDDVTWIIYVTTAEFVQNIDVLFNRQNFERVWIDSSLTGTPKEYQDSLYHHLNEQNNQILEYEREIKNLIENCRHILLSSYRQLQTYHKINKIKKYIMHDSRDVFYIVAWVPESELQNVVDKLDSCPNIEYKLEDENTGQKVPTKLKNNRLFKPFELIVKMYGVPNNRELDPTSFVAITAFLMFGFMFGDVGHGLVFLILGLLLRKKNKDFGAILAYRRLVGYHIWFLVWKHIWKRRNIKSSSNSSNG